MTSDFDLSILDNRGALDGMVASGDDKGRGG